MHTCITTKAQQIKKQPLCSEESVCLGHILTLLWATLSGFDNVALHRHTDVGKKEVGMAYELCLLSLLIFVIRKHSHLAFVEQTPVFCFLCHYRSVQNPHEPGSREHHPHLGAPPPLISPKPPQPPREHHPPPPTTLWNPAALIESVSESRRNHELSGMGHYELSRLPLGPSKYEDVSRRRDAVAMEKYPPLRAPPGLPEPSTFLAELEKSTQSLLNQQRASLPLSSQYEMEGSTKINAGLKNFQGHPGQSRHGQGLGMVPGPGIVQVAPLGMGPDTMLIYDEFLQLHRRPVSKLDLEEKRRREAREKGISNKPLMESNV